MVVSSVDKLQKKKSWVWVAEIKKPEWTSLEVLTQCGRVRTPQKIHVCSEWFGDKSKRYFSPSWFEWKKSCILRWIQVVSINCSQGFQLPFSYKKSSGTHSTNRYLVLLKWLHVSNFLIYDPAPGRIVLTLRRINPDVLFTTKMFISIHLKQLQDMWEVHRGMQYTKIELPLKPFTRI